MQYTNLGDTGLVVSRLAFGAMTFGQVDDGWGSVAKVDETLAKQLVDKAMDAGINFFDTADVYANGQSESMLGQAIGTRRQDVVIATKVGFRRDGVLTKAGLSRRHILQAAEGSLHRLGTDYIDVYIVHRDDPLTPIDETLEALNNLVQRGLVRYVGFSNWSAWKAATAIGLQRQHGWAKFMVAQMYYSLVGRDLEQEFIPFAQYAGVGTMIWSPLAGGFLTGKYSREHHNIEGARLSSPADYFHEFDPDFGFEILDVMREIANAHVASVAQIALAWLLAMPHVSTILLGASKIHQLEDNLGASDIVLSGDELERLNMLTAPRLLYPHWFAAKTPDGLLNQALGLSV